HMPPLGSTVLNTQAIHLVSAWITNDLPRWQSFADWQIAIFGGTNSQTADPFADPDHDLAVNYLEYLVGTDPTNSASTCRPAIFPRPDGLEIAFPQPANRGFQVQSTTNVLDASSWTPLEAPGNEPFFPSTPRPQRVLDLAPSTSAKFYRVRAFAP